MGGKLHYSAARRDRRKELGLGGGAIDWVVRLGCEGRPPIGASRPLASLVTGGCGDTAGETLWMLASPLASSRLKDCKEPPPRAQSKFT